MSDVLPESGKVPEYPVEEIKIYEKVEIRENNHDLSQQEDHHDEEPDDENAVVEHRAFQSFDTSSENTQEEIKNADIPYRDPKIQHYVDVKQGSTAIKNVERALKNENTEFDPELINESLQDPSHFIGTHQFWTNKQMLKQSEVGKKELESEIQKLTTVIDKSELEKMTLISMTHHRRNEHQTMYAFYCGRKVFMKEFRVDCPRTRARFLEEIEFYSTNQHISLINQVGVYTFLYPIAYLVFEYYTTTSLGDVVKQGKLSDMKIQLFIQILYCLQFLEQRGYSMNCLDPDNILLIHSKTSDDDDSFNFKEFKL